ncbi:hypothetical protein GQX74_009485 [Glossina fuscipes]|nr:hypothetical protein GQX74_009485 [Glossina fuscipes]
MTLQKRRQRYLITNFGYLCFKTPTNVLESANNAANVISPKFFDKYIARFGRPDPVQADRGRFTSGYFQDLINFCGMEIFDGTPYNSSSNRIIERFHRTRALPGKIPLQTKPCDARRHAQCKDVIHIPQGLSRLGMDNEESCAPKFLNVVSKLDSIRLPQHLLFVLVVTLRSPNLRFGYAFVV